MADFEKNSESIRVVGIVHRDKDSEGRTRLFFEGERKGGEQVRGFAAGNENITKWLASGKTFYGEIREDQGITNSKGELYARVWRDWDRTAKGQPRQQQTGQGTGQAASAAPAVSLDVAAATYDSFIKLFGGDKAKAALMFQKLDIRIPYDVPAPAEQEPAGFTPAEDDAIPF